MTTTTTTSLETMAMAKIAHEANRAYCETIGDLSQPTWENAPEWQRSSAINGVIFHLDHLNAGPEASHQAWLTEKELDGWKYGLVKDVATKTHPAYLPYDKLPVEQRRKDYLFQAIVHAYMMR